MDTHSHCSPDAIRDSWPPRPGFRCASSRLPSVIHHLYCVRLLALLFVFPQFALAFAQVGGIPFTKPPPLVRIIGAFVSLDDTQHSNLQTLTVQVKKDKWRLRIREIKSLTATTNSGWGLLKDLIPPRLRLVGPDELIALLQRSDIAGQLLVLEGRLYIGDHMLYLTAVTVNEM